MKIIAIILAAGGFAFLFKAGFIFYEVLCMNFKFELPWFDSETETIQTEKRKVSDLLSPQPKREPKAQLAYQD